jgi:hypothetical protein
MARPSTAGDEMADRRERSAADDQARRDWLSQWGFHFEPVSGLESSALGLGGRSARRPRAGKRYAQLAP